MSKSRMVRFWRAWKILSNGHVVFLFKIFFGWDITIRSKNVQLPNIPQPLPRGLPLLDHNFYTNKARNSRLARFWRAWKNLSNGHVVFLTKIFFGWDMAYIINMVQIYNNSPPPSNFHKKNRFFSQNSALQIIDHVV